MVQWYGRLPVEEMSGLRTINPHSPRHPGEGDPLLKCVHQQGLRQLGGGDTGPRPAV